MGNVQEKINSALREEVGKLDRLEAIDEKYERAKTAFAAAHETKATYHDKLQKLDSEIETLHIPIKYREYVHTKITQSLDELDRD